jgi:hypothetical protein
MTPQARRNGYSVKSGWHIFFISRSRDENKIDSDTENGSDTKSAAGEKNRNALGKKTGK